MRWPQLGQATTGPVETVTGGRGAWQRGQARSCSAVNVSRLHVVPWKDRRRPEALLDAERVEFGQFGDPLVRW